MSKEHLLRTEHAETLALKLVLLTLPIGNVGDLTVRVRTALEQGKLFLAEDTRHFWQFLKILGIDGSNKRVFSFHDQTTEQQREHLLDSLGAETIYLVSEAGSPAISDPAYPLIQSVLQRGGSVESFPGASAVITALELAGLPTTPFLFHGFLARQESEQRRVVESLIQTACTHVIYESPHRILATVDLLSGLWPHAQFAVIREMTKKFQTVLRFTGDQWPQQRAQLVARGEFVICLHISSDDLQNHYPHPRSSTQILKLAEEILDVGISTKRVAKLLAEITGRNSRDLYQVLTRERSSDSNS